MSSFSVTMNTILEKVASRDKDFRYMAASDLQNELSKREFRADSDMQTRLCRVVLQQLEDASGDISALAVKCLGLLVPKVGDEQLKELLRKLCDKCVSSKKEEHRDVATIGLKTIVQEVTDAKQAEVLVDVITPTLVKALTDKDSFEVVNESLDIAISLLERFGNVVTAKQQQAKLQPALLPLLDDRRVALRKRTISALAALAVYLNDAELEATSQHLLQKLQQKDLPPDNARTYMQSIGALSRAVGHRFGGHLGVIVPLAISYCDEAGDGEEELQEYCLQALESFVLRSPHEVRPHLETVTAAALKYLSFDPNYADDMDADSDGGDEEDELSDEEYSDDDDTSWKVRRAAAKVVAAVITSFPDLLNATYPTVVPALLARFREREETVKADVFATFVSLLQQIEAVAKYDGGRGEGALSKLAADSPDIIKAAARQLGDKSAKTKTGALQLLQQLVAVQPDSMQSHIGTLLPALIAILNDKSSTASTMKIQALVLLRLILASSSAKAFEPHIKGLGLPLLGVLEERYYKVVAEGLRVTEELVRTMRPSPEQPLPGPMKDVAAPLHSAVAKRLAGADQDQEVKDAAISATATLLALLGDALPSQLPASLQVLLDRLGNDITRLTAVKGWGEVAASPLVPASALQGVLEPLVTELTSFLRKANRLLRQASLATLEALVANHGEQIGAASLEAAVAEVAPLINDADLIVTALSLQLTESILKHQPVAAADVAKQGLPAAMALVRSPLLQAAALSALQGFFVALVGCKPAKTSFKSLLSSLLEAGKTPDTGKPAQLSVAQCIAVLCASAGAKQTSSTVTTLLQTLQGGSDENAQRLALLTLGEIGRSSDLSSYDKLEEIILDTLQDGSKSEELKSAASVALGGLTTGALKAYLPTLLSATAQAAGQPKTQFLLLAALNEALTSLAAPDADLTRLSDASRNQVLQLLLGSCEGEEDVRGVVAECLGHTALLAPAPVLSALRSRAADASPAVRAAVAAAPRAMVVERRHPIDDVLQSVLPELLQSISDSDRHVRKAAVQSLSTVAHHKPGLLAGQLPPLLPRLYQQTVTGFLLHSGRWMHAAHQVSRATVHALHSSRIIAMAQQVVDGSLIRVVDLGPFKHRIDDGLELRKAAFETMDVLLDNARDQLDYPTFITHLQGGLQDHYDVKMPAHALLGKLAARAPAYVVSALDQLVPPLQKTLTAKLKSDAVKQEVDRNDDMLRSCLRAIDAITRIPNADSVASFKGLLQNTVQGGLLAAKFQAVRQEREEAGSAAAAMDTS